MLGGLSALEFFGALGTAVTILGGGVTIGHKLRGWKSGKELDQSRELLKTEKARSMQLEATLKGIRDLLDDQTDVWLRSPPDSMRHFHQIRSSIPIVTVCNFKGGVGKTALTSLLAGYFDLYKQKRVLLIDFDYQGSLTDTLLASADLPQFEASARRLLEPGALPENVIAHAYSLHPALPQTKLFSCFYGFNRIENTVMMRWIAERQEARYLTHAVLSDPKIQTRFDLVIIDAPPRLSTATVNAFCASTHVLIPTILDSMSTQAALNTIGVIREFRDQLNPALEVLGIVPTMVSQVTLNGRETDYLQRMKARLPEFWRQASLPHVYEEERICRREKIATSLGSDLAFNSSQEVRQMTIALGNALAERLFRNERDVLGNAASEGTNVTPIESSRLRA
jgi:cellulose biosynthesis protein BcsQ